MYVPVVEGRKSKQEQLHRPVHRNSIVHRKAQTALIVSFIVTGVKMKIKESRNEKDDHHYSSPPPLSSSTALFFEKNET